MPDKLYCVRKLERFVPVRTREVSTGLTIETPGQTPALLPLVFLCTEGAGLAPYGVYRDLSARRRALMSFVLRSQSVFVVTIVFFDCQQLRSHSHVAC